MKLSHDKSQSLSDSEKQLVAHVSSALDQEASALPMHLQSRLNAARSAAIEGKSKKKLSGLIPNMYWGAGALSFSLAIVFGLNVVFNSPNTVNNNQTVDEWQLVAANTDFTLLQEDLEFYVWLQEQENVDLLSSENSG